MKMIYLFDDIIVERVIVTSDKSREVKVVVKGEFPAD